MSVQVSRWIPNLTVKIAFAYWFNKSQGQTHTYFKDIFQKTEGPLITIQTFGWSLSLYKQVFLKMLKLSILYKFLLTYAIHNVLSDFFCVIKMSPALPKTS